VTAALRFFYVETLGWSLLRLNLPPRPAHKHLPQVLSVEELQRLFRPAHHPKHRALLPLPDPNRAWSRAAAIPIASPSRTIVLLMAVTDASV
jgi:hypothetical protein